MGLGADLVELEELAVGVGAELDAQGGARLAGQLVGDDVVVFAVFLADAEEQAGLLDAAAGGADFGAGVALVAGLGEAAQLGFEDAVLLRDGNAAQIRNRTHERNSLLEIHTFPDFVTNLERNRPKLS